MQQIGETNSAMGGGSRLWCASAATLLLWLAAPVIGTAAADDGAGAFARIGPLVVQGRGADLLHVGLGAFDVFDDHTAAAAEIQYRFGRKLWFIGPAVGLVGNTDGGLYGYVGLYADVSIGRLHLTPGLALGGYGQGSDSKDLGGIFQFRQSVDLAWRFAGGSRLGLRIAHISNAHIQDFNPGEEEIYLTYGIPLGPLF